MPIPKQVLAQQAELEELELSMQEPTEPEAPEGEPDTPDTEVNTSETPEREAPPEPVPVEESRDSEELWEHKYRRLQGKYDAEVPRLHAALRDLEAQIEALKAAPEPTKQPSPKRDPVRLVTDDDVNAFGDDLIDLQRRVAREVASEFTDQIEALRAENEDLKKQVGETGARVGAVSFETQLNRMIPDFADVNADKRWITWLDELDPILLGPRRSVVQGAWDRGDVEAMAKYVDLWKSTINAKPSSERQGELRRQVQPKRASGTSGTAAPTGKTYTDADARAAFERVRRLNANGKYDEAAKLEAEISLAYVEGRVMA